MILKDFSVMTVAGLEVESSNSDPLLDASSSDVRNQNSYSLHSSEITDLSTISVSSTSVVPVTTQGAKDAAADVPLLSRGVATAVISQTKAAVSRLHVSDPSSSTFAVKSSKIVSVLTPTLDAFSHRASSVTLDVRTDSKLLSLKSNPATTSAPRFTTTASDVHTTVLSHAVEKVDSTSSEIDLSTVTELPRTVKPEPSSRQSSSDVAFVTYNLPSSTLLDVTDVSTSATSLLTPDGMAVQSQSKSLASHSDGHDTTSQNVLINIIRTNTLAVSTADGFTTSSVFLTDFPTTTTTPLVKSSSSQPHSVSTGQTTQKIIETSSASEQLTTTGKTSTERLKKVTSVQVSSTEGHGAESTVIPKTNFPFVYDSQSLRLNLSWITSEHSSSNHATSAKVNGSIDSTAGASGSVSAALYVSLSLVFGLGVIIVISIVVFCLLRNYCRQFHRCCSKHPGRCRFKNSCPCVETCPYHGLHPQRLTETPDLISESVHAQITRIHRGSSHPDEIALLERSIEHSDSLNELDQFVFEDPDLMTPSSSDLFIDCRLASTSDRTPELNPADFSEDLSRSSRLNRSGRSRKNIVGAWCFGGGSGAHDFAHQSHCDFQDDVFGYGGGHGAIVVENPYLKPSCHAHVDPGPNWMPFHPYDPVYVPHHDPVGMARRLDKEGKYVTSPRLRMRNQVYEELGRNARDQYRAPVNRLPPVVPNRSAAAALGGFAPVAPARVSSRQQSPRVPVRGASLERSAKSPPVAPMRISSRASPVVQSKGASLERRFRGAAQVAPVQIALPPSPPLGAAVFGEGPVPSASSRASSRAVADPLLDRCLPELPVAQHGRELSMLSAPGSQRDSTSSSTTIPGHEYSRVDFGNREQPNPVVTTAEVEPYETDSDSCRDGAYESIDFPKSPPSP